MTRLFTTAVLAAVAALASGCTPSLDHVDVHPALTHDTLREGGVVVVPAASFVAGVGPLDAQQLLVSNVHDWRDAIDVRADIGDDADAVASAVAGGRAAPGTALRAVADRHDARFVAVVVLHDYFTHFTEIHDTIVDEDGVAYTETTLEAEGNLDGELLLIESGSGETWWRGDHVESDTESVTYDEFDWFPPSDPEPPSAFALTDDLLEAMVRNWPSASD